MHWIQKHILQHLSVHASRRYVQLKPPSVDGNLFMYHMQQLQKAGYIDREERAYQLSPQGKVYVSRMSLRKGVPLMQPKIVVMLVARNDTGQYLLFRWRRQPYYGLVSLPFSKLHFGRTLLETLEEALFYKTKLKGTFTFLGDVYLRTQTNPDDATAEHTLAHIYEATNLSGTLGEYDGLTGEPFWGHPSAVPPGELTPGFADILKVIESGQRGFMKEIIANISLEKST